MLNRLSKAVLLSFAVAAPALSHATEEYETTDTSLTQQVLQNAASLSDKAIAWRHDIHQHPELGNQETRTAALVAEHLRNLGMEVTTGVGRTGVVGVLEGGLPGPVVALRADMDALPVKETTGLPYASEVTQSYLGKEQPIMHACGHDAHVAILMAVAENLTSVKDQIPGTIKFIFQPAEEGPSDYDYQGENSFGARLMVEEGVLKNPDVNAIFALHVTSAMPTGILAYRSGPLMASSGKLEISVQGQQTHGAQPWDGIDPITTSAQIISGLQTVVSRQTNILRAPAVVSIGTIEGGQRHNIIPDNVRMTGTIRTFDDTVQEQVNQRITRMARHVAQANGTQADVSIVDTYATTVNDPDLTAAMLPTLKKANGGEVYESPKVTGAEDFSFYAQKVPGMYFFLGVTPRDQMQDAAPNHAPGFFVDDAALVVGVRALSAIATDYLTQTQ
ncbi:amidohydrolase [Pseudomonas sp. EA_105y_Pfl2_R69]|uniref:amidohydrolase n=1 Tax=Pseudomonas sp. EA_105y_Pfl2_R69 TaxID=3088683 RepID=UPI0030DC955D